MPIASSLRTHWRCSPKAASGRDSTSTMTKSKDRATEKLCHGVKKQIETISSPREKANRPASPVNHLQSRSDEIEFFSHTFAPTTLSNIEEGDEGDEEVKAARDRLRTEVQVLVEATGVPRSVDELLTEYKGREELLLSCLRVQHEVNTLVRELGLNQDELLKEYVRGSKGGIEGLLAFLRETKAQAAYQTGESAEERDVLEEERETLCIQGSFFSWLVDCGMPSLCHREDPEASFVSF
ncbi:hypothetical protein ACHAWF_006017 [Thalassiosira exigua]